MDSKVIVITGASGGIGLETAYGLVKQGHKVYLLGRNTAKMEALQSRWSKENPNAMIEVLFCDLSDFSTVQTAAMQIMMVEDKIDVLINNAGGIFPSYKKSKNGYEMTIAVNHLGHFLLTKSLVPTLLESRGRVINVSSEAHRAAKVNWGQLDKPQSYQSFQAYAVAKLFNIGFTKGLQERYGSDGIHSFSLHPGVVRTSFGQSFDGWVKWLIKLSQPFMISAAQGAETSIFLATKTVQSLSPGAYYVKSKPKLPHANALNKDFQEKLWQYSMDAVADYLPMCR